MTAIPIQFKKRLFACLITVALLPALALAGSSDPHPAAPAKPVVPARTFRMSDFGATPDGHTYNTAAFHQAIAAVNAAGGGTLIVAAGDYLTGRFDLCSRINLHLERGAHIRFSDKFSDYPHENGRPHPLLGATNCEDIIISGEGMIDGQGQAWWDAMKKVLSELHGKPWVEEEDPRPWMIELQNCRRIRVEGVKIRNSPKFQCAFLHCEDITVEGVNIYAPEKAYNTDGIDPINCKRVLIRQCNINTGDDCVALKASRDEDDGGTSDVLIEDCSFHHGHGCSLGSGVGPFIRNVLVQHCTFDSTTVGVQYKSSRTRGGIVENITFTDLSIRNVGEAVKLISYYPGNTMPERGESVDSEPVTSRTPHVHNFVVRNIVAVDCDMAGEIIGLPESPHKDIVVENVRIAAKTGLRIAYTQGIVLHHVDVQAQSGEAISVEHGVTGLKREQDHSL